MRIKVDWLLALLLAAIIVGYTVLVIVAPESKAPCKTVQIGGAISLGSICQ